MQEKVAAVGFDWPDSKGAWDKVKEELGEFETAENVKEKTAEMGDLFFALINYCRLEGINPDEALSLTNQKFKYRFQYMEKKADEAETALSEMTLEEMDVWWEEAKKKSRD